MKEERASDSQHTNDDWDDLTPSLAGVVDDQTGEYRQLQLDKALLIMLVGSDANRTYVVEEETTIGRSLDSTVPLRSEDVSRNHAVIRRPASGQFTIEDLGSRNGTLVNGVPVKQQLLKYGDKIRIGSGEILMFSRYDRIEDKLLQSQRLESIGQMAGGVAHDFNNILGAVLANVGFLKGIGANVTFDDTEVQECLGDIDTAARRAVDLTRQLLGLSRNDRKSNAKVYLGKLVREVAALVSRTFGPRIDVVVEICQELSVVGDGSQLHQALMNLCINARDAMPDGGTLTLSVKEVHVAGDTVNPIAHFAPGAHAELQVQDTGVGMDDRVSGRLFEPFFTTKEKGKGTGLGLATVMSIARQHGGQIQVDSEVGEGSRFKILLPANESVEVAAMAPETISRGTMNILSGDVLLVDDEEVFLRSTRRLLEGLGYTVHTARDGVEAVTTLEAHGDSVDLVILDLVMPNMSGMETFHALRALRPSVKVLLSSGRTELSGARDLLSDGADGFLQKPYDAGALGEAMSRVLFSISEGSI